MTNKGQSFAELLWGDKLKERYIETFIKGKKATQKEAKEVLDAMIHPEARKVLSFLETQMNTGASKASYDEGPVTPIIEGTILFCDESYSSGLYSGFAELIETAHPNYKWVASPIAAMCFKRYA